MANEDPDYLEWIWRQQCCVPRCRNKAQPHHPREGVGLAMKAHDHMAVPLCYWHHIEGIHRLTSGYFKGWSREQVRAFCERESAATRARYLGAAGLHVEPIPF